MRIVDAHHHLWAPGVLHYPWLADTGQQAIFGSFDRIRRNYLINEYRNESQKYQVVKSVHVEADQDPVHPVAETRWVQEVADEPGSGGLPQAIVAHADFTRDNVEETLAAHCEFRNVRGIRQILNYHPDPRLTYTPVDMLADDGWRRRFAALQRFNLSFDLQIYYQQMASAVRLAQENEGIQIILDHAGMPVERDDDGINGWRQGMASLAVCPNVAVKISGLGMCDPDWTTDSIRSFVLETIDLFGVDRCMFASNFPVDSLFSDFDRLFDAYLDITRDFAEGERDRLFRANAERIYRI